MAESGNFDLLVSVLSQEERQGLLEKIHGQVNISMEPLYVEEHVESLLSIQEQYNELPWHIRLWYFIQSLFKSAPPMKLFEDRQIARIGREIDKKSPNLYDYKEGKLLASFYEQLVNLKDAARFFYAALAAGFNQDKGTFYGFLGSLEMPAVNAILVACTEPPTDSVFSSENTEREQRQIALQNMEEAFLAITDENRKTMYFDVRYLFCMKKLASFPFDRILKSFSKDPHEKGKSCYIMLFTALLSFLNNILQSIKEFPPMPLLEALFVFMLQEKNLEPAAVDRTLQSFLAKAESSITVIRDFNKKVPLNKILRCANRNLTLTPKEITGGEDWFAVYREYWRKRVEASLEARKKLFHRQELLNLCRDVLKGADVQGLADPGAENNSEGIPFRGIFGISFLNTFYSVVFGTDINRILEPIFIYGEFYSRDNRIKFIENYNELIKLEDDLQVFEQKISPSGVFGRQFINAKEDISDPRIRRRKLRQVVDDASRAAAEILDSAKRASSGMISVLEGILKIDILAKTPKLSGGKNEFTDGVAEAIEKFQKVIKILNDSDALDDN